MVYRVNPVKDPRWLTLVQRHNRASVFHSPEWLEALRSTYGYEPIVWTTSRPDSDLTNGILFCHVKSWITGSRLVSLPFSDHCEPLFDDLEDSLNVLDDLAQQMSAEKWKYIEVRPMSLGLYPLNTSTAFQESATFCFHNLSLQPELNKLMSGFHKNHVQRKIRRAEREGLSYETGRSEKLLNDFYKLVVFTRKRHQLPPQPRAWFRNLISCMGEGLTIHTAYKVSTPVASIMTLLYKDCVVYKYGGSDARLNNMGGTPFLLWKAIQQSKNQGVKEFDMGRSDWDHTGLINFKDHWGASRSKLQYLICSAKGTTVHQQDWKMRSGKWLLNSLPDSVFAAAGRLLYRHIA